MDEFYQANYNITKNSGNLKSMVQSAANALGIQHYVMSRLTGTRFVGHRVEAFNRLLNMWPAFIAAYENCLNDAANRTIHAKVQGQLKNFLSYKMLCLVCTYLDVLEKITPASKVFEGEGLLAYEVRPSIDYTLMELEECKESAGKADEFLDSNLARFKLREDTEGGFSLSEDYLKGGEVSKKAADKRAFMTYNFKGMRHLRKAE